MKNDNLFVSDEERYAELDSFYRYTYRDNEIKQYVEGNEDKVAFVKENYPVIIEYLKKEYPSTIDVYYGDTSQVDDRKIAVLATDASFFANARKDQHHFGDKEHFVSGLNFLMEIAENETWSKEAYIRNFSNILDYLEKHDDIDVAEVRKMYAKEVEENRNDTHNPKIKYGGELGILDPGPSTERKLTKLVEQAKYEEFKNLAEPGNGTERQALKYYKVTVLRAVLKEQKLKEAREQHRSNLNKIKKLTPRIKEGMKGATPIKEVSANAPFGVKPKKHSGLEK